MSNFEIPNALVNFHGSLYDLNYLNENDSRKFKVDKYLFLLKNLNP